MAGMDAALSALLTAVGAPAIEDGAEVLDLAVVPAGSLEERPAASADVVLAADALRALSSARGRLRCVEEIARILRIGGWAAFALSTDPVAHDERQSRRGMFRALAGAPPERAKNFVPLDALGATAIRAGLRLDRIEGANTRDTLVLAFKDASQVP